MANYRNEFEFRSGLLDALGVEHTEADAKNEERWRAKMLDGLEVEYNQNDVNQFDLFRAKLVEGVEAKAEGGGGDSDFSTAEVTVINTTSQLVTASGVSVMETPISAIVPFNTIGPNSNINYTVPLYKGLCSWTLGSGDVSVSVSGNINYEYGYINISGDGTITIS